MGMQQFVLFDPLLCLLDACLHIEYVLEILHGRGVLRVAGAFFAHTIQRIIQLWNVFQQTVHVFRSTSRKKKQTKTYNTDINIQVIDDSKHNTVAIANITYLCSISEISFRDISNCRKPTRTPSN